MLDSLPLVRQAASKGQYWQLNCLDAVTAKAQRVGMLYYNLQLID